MAPDEKLLEQINALSAQVKDLQREIRRLEVKNADVPDDVLAAIAAGVAAYLGYAGHRRLPRYAPATSWRSGVHTAHPTTQLVR